MTGVSGPGDEAEECRSHSDVAGRTRGPTRVLASPGGYDAAENPEYDPELCIEVETRATATRTGRPR